MNITVCDVGVCIAFAGGLLIGMMLVYFETRRKTGGGFNS